MGMYDGRRLKGDTPERRYLEWANQLEPGGHRLTKDQLDEFTEVYLLDATDSEADRDRPTILASATLCR